jgi:hypothetical protein
MKEPILKKKLLLVVFLVEASNILGKPFYQINS